MNEYRDKVMAYRVKCGITQEEFAKRCGISRQTVVAIENREHYSVNLVTRHKLEKVINNEEE